MKYIDFFNVPILNIDLDNFHNYLIDLFKEKRITINIMGVNLTALERFDKEMYNFTKTFDFVIADGNGLVKLSFLAGKKIKYQIPISTLSKMLINDCSKYGLRLFLLGAENYINERAINNLKINYPLLVIDGYHGYFDEKKMEEVFKRVEIFTPDVILVGISSPKKERVIENISKRYQPSINVACGGYLDILGGKTKRAPLLIQKICFEWIYRFYREPRRMFGPMIIGGIKGLYILAKLMWYGRFSRQKRKLYQII